jgi:hypothetical protein
MAFPTTISTSASFETTVGCGGPFLSSGGNVYVILRDTTDTTKLRAFKATDPTTSFSNVGTDFSLGSGLVARRIAAVQSGDNIHVTTSSSATSSSVTTIHYHVFSMSSDTWTTTNTVVKSAIDISTVEGGNSVIAVRSNGDVIILYQSVLGASMGNNYSRVSYARKVGSTWTVDVAVDNAGAVNWVVDSAILGSSDRTHFFFHDDAGAVAYQRTLTSANSLQTFPSSFSSVATGTYAGKQRGVAYVSGANTEVRMPFIDSSQSGTLSAKLTSSDTPTPTTDADITGTSATGGAHSASFAADGTTLWHVYKDNASDIYRQSNADGAGWSTPVSFYAGTIASLTSNIYTRGSSVVLGIVFSETNPKYTEYTISGGGPVTHACTGALTAGTGALAGTAQHKAKHTTTGALTGVSALVGTAQHKAKHTTTGALTGVNALAGVASSKTTRPSTGALTAGTGALAGTAQHRPKHTTTGALVGASALAGTARRFRAHANTGALPDPALPWPVSHTTPSSLPTFGRPSSMVWCRRSLKVQVGMPSAH